MRHTTVVAQRGWQLSVTTCNRVLLRLTTWELQLETPWDGEKTKMDCHWPNDRVWIDFLAALDLHPLFRPAVPKSRLVPGRESWDSGAKFMVFRSFIVFFFFKSLTLFLWVFVCNVWNLLKAIPKMITLFSSNTEKDSISSVPHEYNW